MSIPGAIVQVIFGYLAGSYIIQKGKTPEMVNGLFVAGLVTFERYWRSFPYPDQAIADAIDRFPPTGDANFAD